MAFLKFLAKTTPEFRGHFESQAVHLIKDEVIKLGEEVAKKLLADYPGDFIQGDKKGDFPEPAPGK